MAFSCLHIIYKTTPIYETESFFALYSEMRMIIEKLNDSNQNESTVFCFIPSKRIIPQWEDQISQYCEESETITIEVYPITAQTVVKFHQENVAVQLPNHLQHFVDEEMIFC